VISFEDGVHFYTVAKRVTTHLVGKKEIVQISVDTWDGVIGQLLNLIDISAAKIDR